MLADQSWDNTFRQMQSHLDRVMRRRLLSPSPLPGVEGLLAPDGVTSMPA